MSAVARLVAGIDGSGPMSLADHRRTYPAPHPPGPRPDLGLIEAVERAGLRGRGGAAFPTGTKLRTVASMKRTPVVLGNGSEGEPMSTKDKVLMTYLPHLVIDGAMLAAAAVGADEVVIGIEDGATSSWRAMQHALDERSGPEPHVPARLVPVPARYVSGEETALVNVVNGGPGLPTATPPRPFERGVSGRPTLVDNVETLAHLTQIARWGPAWFRQVGTVDEPGTVMVTMGGAVHRSGVQEVELGTTMRELVDLAGGAPRGVSAILCGGFYGAWLSASEAHRLPLTNADLRTYGAGVGCGMIGVLPQDACGVQETARLLRWMAGETAGQCGPCVHGLPALAGAMEALAAGTAEFGVLDQLQRWAGQIEGRGGCRFPDGAVRLLRSALRVFAVDIARHRSGHTCAVQPVLSIPRRTGR
ncbi:MAG: NADH-ubiquinone oxidoreductase-F iron-sulfur binding region domain-containing protein [Ilumatobacteraceae bacterium]